jgi:flagellar biosynthesis/type III secretory pathway protein FliH
LPDIFRGTDFVLSENKVKIPEFSWGEEAAEETSASVLPEDVEISEFVPERFDSVSEAEEAFVPAAPEITEVYEEAAAPEEYYQAPAEEAIPPQYTVEAPPVETPPAEELSIEEMIKFTPEELEEIYRPEIDAIKTDAMNKAYYDALNKKKAEIEKCIKNVNDQLDLMVNMQIDYFEKYGTELKYLAIEIAQKMISTKIDEDDMTLNRLVLQTVNASKSSPWLKVEISEHLVGLVDALKEELRNADEYCRMEVVPKAVPDDTVRVTGETGTIDASISTQAENLREAFRNAEEEE